MHINDIFDPALLQEMLAGGYVSTQYHPELSLSIYNYTPSAQYERVWNDVTMQCRGLIMNLHNGEIVARPFAKFFNLAEAIQDGIALPEGDPIVTEKMDGSLGIIYTHDGVSYVATRGSFMSDQAQWATAHLRENYPNFEQPDGTTTLVEIIYPQNRIVVDYGAREELVLLGAIDIETGADIDFNDIDWWDGPRTVNYGYRDLNDAVEMGIGDDFNEDEGVVLTWPREDAPSVRLKVKHPRYVELHRVVTNLSTRSVWEALATDTFDQLLEVVPDEFHPWVRGVQTDLLDKFIAIHTQATHALWDAQQDVSDDHGEYTRRDLAAKIIQTAEHPGLSFAIEDGKDITPRVWQMIKPERSMAMVVDEV